MQSCRINQSLAFGCLWCAAWSSVPGDVAEACNDDELVHVECSAYSPRVVKDGYLPHHSDGHRETTHETRRAKLLPRMRVLGLRIREFSGVDSNV